MWIGRPPPAPAALLLRVLGSIRLGDTEPLVHRSATQTPAWERLVEQVQAYWHGTSGSGPTEPASPGLNRTHLVDDFRQPIREPIGKGSSDSPINRHHFVRVRGGHTMSSICLEYLRSAEGWTYDTSNPIRCSRILSSQPT